MCYCVLLSTTADKDLSADNVPPYVIFQRDLSHCETGAAEVLRYPRKWFVGVKSASFDVRWHLDGPSVGGILPVGGYRVDGGGLTGA